MYKILKGPEKVNEDRSVIEIIDDERLQGLFRQK